MNHYKKTKNQHAEAQQQVDEEEEDDDDDDDDDDFSPFCDYTVERVTKFFIRKIFLKGIL